MWHLSLAMQIPDFLAIAIREIDERRNDLLVVGLVEENFLSTQGAFEELNREIFSLRDLRQHTPTP